MSFDKSSLVRALDLRVRGDKQQSREVIEQLAQDSHTDVREVIRAVDAIQRRLLRALKPASTTEGSPREYASARHAALEICRKELGITDTTVAISLCDRILEDFFA